MSATKTIPAGTRFTRAVVLYPGIPSGARPQSTSVCLCDCGKTFTAFNYSLKSGNTRSCGCLRAEMTAALKYDHGCAAIGAQTPEYKVWQGLIGRCANPNNPAYNDYGGRGIKVCDRWRDFKNFLADVGPRPPGTSIDRFPNNDGNYEPGNTRWATIFEQNNNRRSNKVFTAFGITCSLADHCRRHGIKWNTVDGRLIQGWSIEAALSTPVRKHKPYRNSSQLIQAALPI